MSVIVFSLLKHVVIILTFISDDIFDFFISASEPSYISLSRVNTDIVLEKNFNTESLDGKIVFIQSADPGYDWIFSYGLSGLTTKYGGVASHMSIRCSELNLPAAIGCGELFFNKLKSPV